MSDNAAHILLVDDDAEIRKLLSAFLADNGFRVSTLATGAKVRDAVAKGDVGLVVLDVMLPDSNGFDVCREVRAANATPIIMLTAKGGEMDRIVGLELGADDYLAKPFNPRELLARIKAVLRRAAGADKPAARRLRFEGWALDTLRRELRSPADVLIDLSAGEYDLLLSFAEAPQRVLSREQLLDFARNRTASGYDRSIDVQVSRLRRKLGAEEGAEGLIKTVRGAGYMFTPEVRRE